MQMKLNSSNLADESHNMSMINQSKDVSIMEEEFNAKLKQREEEFKAGLMKREKAIKAYKEMKENLKSELAKEKGKAEKLYEKVEQL